MAKRPQPPKDESGLDVLSRVSGLSKPKMMEIWEDVKANRELLDSCHFHEFTIDITPDRNVGKRWQCTNCGGTIDGVNKNWYEKGLKHAVAFADRRAVGLPEPEPVSPVKPENAEPSVQSSHRSE